MTAIRAGRLLDPETARILTNQVIIVEGTRIREVGANLTIPPGAQVIGTVTSTITSGLILSAPNIALNGLIPKDGW